MAENDKNKGRKFFFGKYKDQYIKDIIVNDTQYITWSMKNIKWFWFNHEEVELYKKQLRLKRKMTQYDYVISAMKTENKKPFQDGKG